MTTTTAPLEKARIEAAAPFVPFPPDGGAWDLPRRSATAQEIVEALDPLLESVLVKLADPAARDVLLDQLPATLGFSSREACLPLAHIATDDILRRDLAAQARAIGDFIAATARRVSESGGSLARYGAQALRDFVLRSHCDGHLWTPAATALLTGARGGPVVMQLYNEWLHQIVLLRDSLIPFADWETLPLPLDSLTRERGLRALEEPRGRFVGDLLTKKVQHTTILRMAQALFGVAPDDNSYGFSAGDLVVLPASVGEPIESSRKALLRWRRADIPGLEGGDPIRFRYAANDYLAEPRSDVSGETADVGAAPAVGRLEGRRIGDGIALIELVVTLREREYRVDLGQALRGHRFSYRPATETYAVRFEGGERSPTTVHVSAGLFALPGMATAETGTHLVALPEDSLAALAILGKIYPENTIIQGDAPWDEVLCTGKNYGAKFVLQRAASGGGRG